MSSNETTGITLEQTNDIAMTIDQVVNDKPELVKLLTNEMVERQLILRELLMNAYVRGFFSGVQNTLLEAKKNAEGTGGAPS